MHNIIIHLMGLPGVGKYTIAKEIVRQDADFRLLDNHHVNNVLFSLIHQDGKTPLPPRIWENTRKIWEAVEDTLIHISPREYSFVITNLMVETENDRAWYQRVQAVAAQRGGIYVPVTLTCDEQENRRRIIGNDRRVRMKATNPDLPARIVAEPGVLRIDHPNYFTLDVTSMPPDQAAWEILKKLKAIA